MLTMKAKYALKALVVLAQSKDEQMQAKGISEEANIPYKFLETILGELRHHQFVHSRRGTAGGFRLAQDSRDIMVADVIRIMDGPLAPIRCASLTAYESCDDCPDEKSCALHHVMRDVRAAMSGVLDRRSIHSLAFFEAPKRKKAANE
ncbi:MAG: Rrf2 family transcriptional regulator [Alphaproteobacteria bacterium]